MFLVLIFIVGGKIKYNGVIIVWNFVYIFDEFMKVIIFVVFVVCVFIFVFCCIVGGCWNEF